MAFEQQLHDLKSLRDQIEAFSRKHNGGLLLVPFSSWCLVIDKDIKKGEASLAGKSLDWPGPDWDKAEKATNARQPSKIIPVSFQPTHHSKSDSNQPPNPTDRLLTKQPGWNFNEHL